MKIIRPGNTKVLNSSKLYCWPADVTWMRSTLFKLIEIGRNDQERSADRTRMVNSSMFGSRFLTERLGHNAFSRIGYQQAFTLLPVNIISTPEGSMIQSSKQVSPQNGRWRCGSSSQEYILHPSPLSEKEHLIRTVSMGISNVSNMFFMNAGSLFC